MKFLKKENKPKKGKSKVTKIAKKKSESKPLKRNKLEKIFYLFKIFFVANNNDNRPDYKFTKDEFYPEIRAKEIVMNGLKVDNTYFSPRLIRKVMWEENAV